MKGIGIQSEENEQQHKIQLRILSETICQNKYIYNLYYIIIIINNNNNNKCMNIPIIGTLQICAFYKNELQGNVEIDGGVFFFFFFFFLNLFVLSYY